MIHYVIMGNDFPEAICSTEELAQRYVAAMKLKDKNRGMINRIYWRAVPFVVDKEPVP